MHGAARCLGRRAYAILRLHLEKPNWGVFLAGMMMALRRGKGEEHPTPNIQ